MADKVRIIVEIDVAPHSFCGTPQEAKAVIENIIRRDARANLYNITVRLDGNKQIQYDDVAAWVESGKTNHVHNVFDDNQ